MKLQACSPHRCFPVNIAKCLRTVYSAEQLRLTTPAYLKGVPLNFWKILKKLSKRMHFSETPNSKVTE